MAKLILPIMIGGALGSVSRYALATWVDARWFASSQWPWGIFLVNATGCFIFGWFYSFSEGRPWITDSMRLAVFAGFLGGFTTFSTFSWQTLDLLRSGHLLAASVNVVGSVAIGLLAVWGGMVAGR